MIVKLEEDKADLLKYLADLYKTSVDALVDEAVREYFIEDRAHFLEHKPKPCTVASANVESYKESY